MDEVVALDSGRLDIRATWVVLRSQPLSLAPGPPSSPALAWEERAASGTSQEFLLDCTLSGPSSPPPLLLLFPVVWMLGSPHLLVALPQVPYMHVVTVTLACMNVALSLESRAHKEGVEQHNGAGLSACWGRALFLRYSPLCRQPRCCRK